MTTTPHHAAAERLREFIEMMDIPEFRSFRRYDDLERAADYRMILAELDRLRGVVRQQRFFLRTAHTKQMVSAMASCGGKRPPYPKRLRLAEEAYDRETETLVNGESSCN